MKKHSLPLLVFLFLILINTTSAENVKVLVFGDSQKIMNEAPAGFLSTMDKITTDPQTKDVSFIMQMGDIVEDCLTSNWTVAREGWQKLDGKIPYVLGIGNNDIANDNGGDKYKQYFPLSFYQTWPSFVSNFDQSINIAQRFSVAGVNWLVISMRISPAANIIAWAENLIVSNPTNRVLIISHDANPTSAVTTMALKHPNVVMVLCGHTETVEPVELNGTQGNKLLYLKTCFHNKVLDMYGCILNFDVNAGTISGRYYSPQYEKFWDDTTAPYYGDSKMPSKLIWSYSGFNFKSNEDLCPNDPNKLYPGECGCGVPEGTCYDLNAPADSIVLQAEDAIFSGPLVATNQTGYNGTGFVDFTNASNDFLTWKVNVPVSGNYMLSFRYSLTTNRPLKLSVNDEVRIASVAFPVTGGWSIWKKYKTLQFLRAGDNTVTLTAIGSSGGNFDELGISGLQIANDVRLPESEINKKGIKVFSDTSGSLNVELTGFEASAKCKVKIFDLFGQMIYQHEISNPARMTINPKSLMKNNIYLVSAEVGSSKLYKKIIL